MSHPFEEQADYTTKEMQIRQLVEKTFAIVAPCWPLKNLIAVNPLQGFEKQPIEEALAHAAEYFEQEALPSEMRAVNIQTIKCLGLYFDQGQATIPMPFRSKGLYHAWRLLAPYDERMRSDSVHHAGFLKNWPLKPESAILECLKELDIPQAEEEEFLKRLISTLPGWAAYIKQKSLWNQELPSEQNGALEYMALRIMITTLLWKEAKQLLAFYQINRPQGSRQTWQSVEQREQRYRRALLKKITANRSQPSGPVKAQFVFCIDVRSEPFRQKLESIGDYQTFGFAGFFGIPAYIKNDITGSGYASCPVLIQAEHEVSQKPENAREWARYQRKEQIRKTMQTLYQSLKYHFTTPFFLVEALGAFAGLWMGIRTFFPRIAFQIKALFNDPKSSDHWIPSLENISLEQQAQYAENALRMMGLTEQWAPFIILCGHGSHTENNAYATALDCGACGGRHGGANAKILAAILNSTAVRLLLQNKGLTIPADTLFIAAEHNTTTDVLDLFTHQDSPALEAIKSDLEKAGRMNNIGRLTKWGIPHASENTAQTRALDWAQVRPEWGLASNAAFIVADRALTQGLDLEGRCFLHSYDEKTDPQGHFLTTILTAPMIVAQWINMQYFFSTWNNVAYGGGSKVTKNIVGKIGIMQGNASDLMHGLPLQSVYQSDTQPFHEPQRLFVLVKASQQRLDQIIQSQTILETVFKQGWVQIARIDPDDHKIYLLNRGLIWQAMVG